MEFEIDRARNMVKDIMPEIRKNMQIIAKEEVEVERLGQQIDQLGKKQEKDRTDLTSLAIVFPAAACRLSSLGAAHRGSGERRHGQSARTL